MADTDLSGDIVVRAMEPGEFDEMKALSVRAFGDDEVIGELLDALRESWAWQDLSYVAELDGRIVGQVLYTSALLDVPDELVNVLVLSPVGVDPDLHHRGVGSELITTTLRWIADTRPEPLVFLEGNPVYYSRFGFVAAGDLGFRRPSLRIPRPAFQVYPLVESTEGLSGTLVYPDAFWRCDAVGLRGIPLDGDD